MDVGGSLSLSGVSILCGLWLAGMFLKGITRLIKQAAFEEVKACCVRMFTMHVIFIPRIDSGRFAPYV